MGMKYSVNKNTGQQNSFPAGSSFDKDRSKSKDYKVFSDSKKASEYAKKLKKDEY